MKKLFLLFLVGLISWSLTSCSKGEDTNRQKILKVYNWSDYMDEDLIPEFEEWYKEQTGEEIKVILQLFDTNEVALAKIEKGKEDFDVFCPSEYIIERMLKNDLLLPLDTNFGKTPNYLKNVSPFFWAKINEMSTNGHKTSDYSVPFMWGTTGIIYNPKYVTAEEVKTWGALYDPKYKGKVLYKEAVRDIFGVTLLYAEWDNISSGKKSVKDLMNDCSDEAIAKVEEHLLKVKPNIAGWEVDFGKEEMVKGKAYMSINWSGDAVWAITEAKEAGVTLDYSVPREGSNLWFDGWVIPKYAKNTKAANYFINYMCRSDNAIRNMDAIGYVSAIATPEILEEKTDSTFAPVNLTYLFGEGADSVRVNPVQYPNIDVIERCGVMHDYGDRVPKVLDMWSRVKGDNLNSGILILIIGGFITLITFIVYNKIKRSPNKKKRKKKSRR